LTTAAIATAIVVTIIAWVAAIATAIIATIISWLVNWFAWSAFHCLIRNALHRWDTYSLGDCFGVGLSWDNREMWHLSGHWLLHHGSNWYHHVIRFGGVGSSCSVWSMARDFIGKGLWDHFGHHFRLGYCHLFLWDNNWWAWVAHWSALLSWWAPLSLSWWAAILSWLAAILSWWAALSLSIVAS